MRLKEFFHFVSRHFEVANLKARIQLVDNDPHHVSDIESDGSIDTAGTKYKKLFFFFLNIGWTLGAAG